MTNTEADQYDIEILIVQSGSQAVKHLTSEALKAGSIGLAQLLAAVYAELAQRTDR
jgi:hypothetical protein